ncbi:hypothetical protein MIMGU_mgv1a006016mg [Erythranthe guttata]|uniref:Hydroxymethylglutaryl-CoA synthase n=1 Tax=Erythranthe guttata TaxID=4155 RepID=A0A022RGV1_ERYGU|nr:hypothetical protein MIMGU_mgv1a006016mg [Erythranthe guttata]
MAKNVGILAMEVYFPPTCIQQEVLEAHDGASKGKYTIGLGQDCMAFCDEVEDVISMSMTAVTSLLEKYGVDPKQIGRLEVGSETVLDKSKSIKTFLMPIFEKCGNTDIEGVDSTNACYGGTAALFNCINWVESNSWDGRYGLVVCTDSAVYAEGPARPTGGAAAIAMLVGPDAPIAFESKLRASHMSHVYDFYKPDLASEYPVVDGKLSQTCYLMALDSCYKSLCDKYEKMEGKQFSINDADYFVFHSPYNKLVQKSFSRLLFNDFTRAASSIDEAAKEKLSPFSSLSNDESYQSRDLEKVFNHLTYFELKRFRIVMNFRSIIINIINFIDRHHNKWRSRFTMRKYSRRHLSRNKWAICTLLRSMLHLHHSSTTKTQLWLVRG